MSKIYRSNDPQNKVVHKTAVLNGVEIAFTNKTLFLVQLGKDNGAYKTKWTFEGDLANAVFYYKALNIGRGYKKRLIAPSFNKPLLARSFS